MAQRKLAILNRQGADIGSWSERKPGHYSAQVLIDKAEALRSEALTRHGHGDAEGAYVLLMRYTRFYELVRADKKVDPKSDSFKRFQRQFVAVLDFLESLKKQLTLQIEAEQASASTMGAGAVAAAAIGAADPDLIDIQDSLEQRFNKLMTPRAPPPAAAPPKPKAEPPAPSPAHTPNTAPSPTYTAPAHDAAPKYPSLTPPPSYPPAIGATHALAAGAYAPAASIAANGGNSAPHAADPARLSASQHANGTAVTSAVQVPAPSVAVAPQPPRYPPPPLPPPETQPAANPSSHPPPPLANGHSSSQLSNGGSEGNQSRGAAASAPPSAAPPPPLPPQRGPPPPLPSAEATAAAPTAAAALPPVAPPPAPPASAPSSAPADALPSAPPPDYHYANTYLPKVAVPAMKLPSGRLNDSIRRSAADDTDSSKPVPGSLYPTAVGLSASPRAAAPEPLRVRAKPRPDEPQDHRSRLTRHMALRGFRIKDVPGDNNCQFHAVADQLDQIGVAGHSAMTLRKKTVQWLKDNGDRPMDDGKVGERTLLRHSVGVEDWGRYIREMSQHGTTWGDEATLLAASVLFRAEIVVISSVSEDYCHIVKPPEIWKVPLDKRIYLGHYHEYHYVSTRPIS